MATKAQLREQVMRYLERYDRSREERLDEREVMLRIDQETNAMAAESMLDNMNVFGDKVRSKFLTVFEDVAIEYYQPRNVYRSKLPAQYVSLANEKGIDYVCPMQSMQDPFIPVNRAFMGLYNGNLAGDLQGQTGFWPESGYIYYTKPIIRYNKVLIRLIISDASQINDDAQYPIPPELEAELVTRVAKFFLSNPTLPDDKNDMISSPIEQ